MKKITTIFLLLLMSIPTLMYGSELKPTNWFNDFTGLLNKEQQNAINEKLSDFEKSTSIEISYAIVPSLENQSIEEFTNKLFREWGVGKKGANNGLLIVIAPSEHKFRVEPGYGLEPFLTDNICERLSMANFPDNFRANNYFDGIMNFTDDVIIHLGKISWKDRLDMQRKQLEAQKAQRDHIISTIIGIVVFLLIVCMIIIAVIKIRKENEKTRKFNEQKQKLADKYKTTILTLNKSLSIYKVKNVIEDYLIVNQILTSKTQEDAIKVCNQAIDSLNPNYNLIDILAKYNSKKSEIAKTYDILVSKEKKYIIPTSLSYESQIGDNIENEFYTIEDIDKINKWLSSIIKLNNDYNVRIIEIGKYASLINADIDLDEIDSYINKNVEKYSNSEFKASPSDYEPSRTKMKEQAIKFLNEEKSFSNLEKLDFLYKKYNEAKAVFNGYIKTIEDLNVKYNGMVNTLKSCQVKINQYEQNFNKYLNNPEVKETNKDSIRNFVITLTSFEENHDVISSYNYLMQLYEKADMLIRSAQSDIDEEQRKRDEIARKKREEEERIRRRKREEEEEEERDRQRRNSYSSSSSYYDSGYSSSSSSDSSSFGGFGGGDSGGGGFSGGW